MNATHYVFFGSQVPEDFDDEVLEEIEGPDLEVVWGEGGPTMVGYALVMADKYNAQPDLEILEALTDEIKQKVIDLCSTHGLPTPTLKSFTRWM